MRQELLDPLRRIINREYGRLGGLIQRIQRGQSLDPANLRQTLEEFSDTVIFLNEANIQHPSLVPPQCAVTLRRIQSYSPQDLSKAFKEFLKNGGREKASEIAQSAQKSVDQGRTTWADTLIRLAIASCLKSIELQLNPNSNSASKAHQNTGELFSALIAQSMPKKK